MPCPVLLPPSTPPGQPLSTASLVTLFPGPKNPGLSSRTQFIRQQSEAFHHLAPTAVSTTPSLYLPFKKIYSLEVPLWLSGLRTQHSVREAAGSIPGLTQCVEDVAVPQAADAAQNQCYCGSSHCGAVETKPTSIHENPGSIPGFAQWVKVPGWLWLWLWHRLQSDP